MKFCVCKLVPVCAQLGCCTHARGSIVVDQLTWLLPTAGAPVEVVGNHAVLPLSCGLMAACYSRDQEPASSPLLWSPGPGRLPTCPSSLSSDKRIWNISRKWQNNVDKASGIHHPLPSPCQSNLLLLCLLLLKKVSYYGIFFCSLI